MQSLFLHDSSVVFLNHGSYGSCPRVVFEYQQQQQRRLESEPLLFFRSLGAEIRKTQKTLQSFLHAPDDTIVLQNNVTTALNVVAHSLAAKIDFFSAGDEILSTSHEYGACHRLWSYWLQSKNVVFKHVDFSLPIDSQQSVVDQLFSQASNRTKVIFVSHITSATALILPVVEICKKARELGILTVIDGAHAPGQIHVDLTEMDPDFYGANCHKWMMAAKGVGFLYARKDKQHLLEPLCVSWGYEPEKSFHMGVTGNRFIDVFSWSGTDDPSSFLSVSAAIEFYEKNDWKKVREQCHNLASIARKRFADAIGEYGHIYPDSPEFFGQMVLLPLPAGTDSLALSTRLFDEFKVEIPGTSLNGRPFLRISIQGYNTEKDVDALVDAVKKILGK